MRAVILEGVAKPSERQVAAAGVDLDVVVRSIEELCADPSLLEFDVIVAMLPGTRLLKLRRSVEVLVRGTGAGRRPVLVTGYNGIVYEYAQEGLLWRLGYDVICVNSDKDRRAFSKISRDVGLDDRSLVVTGVLMADRRGTIRRRESTSIETVVFAPQAVVPRRRVERVYLLERLVEYARSHPERTVVVKPRTAPGERTFHVERYPFPMLWEEDFKDVAAPSNLEFRYGPLSDHLMSADLLVTVSSTAVFEALACGVRACVLEDFGLRERMGTHFFTGSGLNASFEDLIHDRLPEPNIDWLRDNGFLAADSLDGIVTHVRRLKEDIQRSPDRFTECYYTGDRTPQVIGELDRSASARSAETSTSWTSWAEGALDRTHRKARKLVRDPRSFLADSAWLRPLRRIYSDD